MLRNYSMPSIHFFPKCVFRLYPWIGWSNKLSYKYPLLHHEEKKHLGLKTKFALFIICALSILETRLPHTWSVRRGECHHRPVRGRHSEWLGACGRQTHVPSVSGWAGRSGSSPRARGSITTHVTHVMCSPCARTAARVPAHLHLPSNEGNPELRKTPAPPPSRARGGWGLEAKQMLPSCGCPLRWGLNGKSVLRSFITCQNGLWSASPPGNRLFVRF